MACEINVVSPEPYLILEDLSLPAKMCYKQPYECIVSFEHKKRPLRVVTISTLCGLACSSV
jgi:hypothetical protein